MGKTFSFFQQLHLWIHTFPKVERHSLGVRLEDLTLEIAQELLYTHELPTSLKKGSLQKISSKLNVLKLLVRVAFETKCIDQNKYLILQSKLQEIGKMLGGWIRSLSS